MFKYLASRYSAASAVALLLAGGMQRAYCLLIKSRVEEHIDIWYSLVRGYHGLHYGTLLLGYHSPASPAADSSSLQLWERSPVTGVRSNNCTAVTAQPVAGGGAAGRHDLACKLLAQ